MKAQRTKGAALMGNFESSMGNTKIFSVQDYDLAATLSSGQAFRWQPIDRRWVGVIGNDSRKTIRLGTL